MGMINSDLVGTFLLVHVFSALLGHLTHSLCHDDELLIVLYYFLMFLLYPVQLHYTDVLVFTIANISAVRLDKVIGGSNANALFP